MVPLDPALKALAFGTSGYRDGFSGLEYTGIENLADLEFRRVGYPELLQDAVWARAGFPENAQVRPSKAPLRSRAEAELHSAVSIRSVFLDLYNRTWPRLNHGYGDQVVVLVVGLGHSDFLSDQSQHVTTP